MTSKPTDRERNETIIVIYLITPGDVISATARTELQKAGNKKTSTTEQIWKKVKEARQDDGGKLGDLKCLSFISRP